MEPEEIHSPDRTKSKIREIKSLNKNSLKYQIRTQSIKGFSFLPSIKCSIIFSVILGLWMTILGIIVFSISGDIKEVSTQYDVLCPPGTAPNCRIAFNVTESITAPVFLYLVYANYYQNHRSYVRSFYASQLAGDSPSASDIDTRCTPATTNAYLLPSKNTSADGTYLDPNAPLNPCGLRVLDQKF